jgi:hypothetical protein
MKNPLQKGKALDKQEQGPVERAIRSINTPTLIL